MKKRFLLDAIIFLLVAIVHAQSAQKISEIIATPSVSYGQAAYLAGVYASGVSESASYAQAFDKLQKDGVIASGVKENDKITLQDASYLFANAAQVQGGLFYTLFPNARYAYKELKAKGVLPQTADSSMTVSGRDALAVLNGCIALAGGDQ